MYNIKHGKYKIEQNKSLVDEAKALLLKTPNTTMPGSDNDFYENIDLINRLIGERSRQIDKALADFMDGQNLNNLVGETCQFVLDVETEYIIDQLFEREKQIKNIKATNPTQELLLIRKLR